MEGRNRKMQWVSGMGKCNGKMDLGKCDGQLQWRNGMGEGGMEWVNIMG